MKGDKTIREWAHHQGLTTASRGRLPRSITEAYADARFDLLANYLEPQFGNIYGDIDVTVAGYDMWTWNDELKAAVRHYLLDEFPSDLWPYFFDRPAGVELDEIARQQQIDELLARDDPFDVACLVRGAAISAVPTLRELYDMLLLHGRKTWPTEYEQADVVTWLDAHVEKDRLRELDPLCAAAHPEDRQPPTPPDAEAITAHVSPAQLLTAWQALIVSEP